MQASAVVFSPYTNKFYNGSVSEGFDFKHDSNLEVIAVLHPDKLAKEYQGAQRVPGKTYDRQAAIEYVSHEMVRQAERYVEKHGHKQAAVDSTSLQNITRVELLTEIINRQYKDVFLINGVRKVPVPKLKLDYDIQIHIKTRGKGALVPKRQKPHVEAPEFVQAKFDMVAFGKLSRMIDTTDEDELSALISPMSTSLDDLAQVLSQDENLLIYDEMTNFVQKTKGSWSAKNANGDFSARNPLDDISVELDRINSSPNHGRANVFVSNQITLGRYLSNTHLQGYTRYMDREGNGVGTLPAFPGLMRITDSDIPTGTAFLYDIRALSYGEGPMMSESFRDPQSGVMGHVIRKWVQPLIPTKLRTAWGAKLDNLS